MKWVVVSPGFSFLFFFCFPFFLFTIELPTGMPLGRRYSVHHCTSSIHHSTRHTGGVAIFTCPVCVPPVYLLHYHH